jgi:hypothetical protein
MGFAGLPDIKFVVRWRCYLNRMPSEISPIV